MADHFSGPRALSDPASDITDVYAFPSPERRGHLVLVLDVFPATTATALFSDALSYRFRLRPVTATTAGGRPAFMAGADEYAFDFNFAVPSPDDGPDSMVQAGTCTTPGGVEIPFRTGEEKSTEMYGLRIFAGPRLDPFFIDLAAEQATHALDRLAFRPEGINAVDGADVLSIILELDTATVLGPDTGPLLGVVGETLTSGGHPVRLERMGRPEIKNFILADKKFDTVNRDIELRDLYNAEDAFTVSPAYAGAYRARMNANLPFFDRLDGRIDWPPDDQGVHPLTEVLLADFLVVDTSKPFSDGSFRDRACRARRPLAHHLRRPTARRRHRGWALHAAGRRPRRTANQRRPGRADPAGHPQLPLPGQSQSRSAGPASRAPCRGVGTAGGGDIITGLTDDDRRLTTTSGVIALTNLQAQINCLTARAAAARSGQAASARPAVAEQAQLVDLLILGGHLLGCIADYEHAAERAEQLARNAPDDAAASLAQARTRAAFHRFREALADLDAAGRRGGDRAALQAERAAILQAVWCYADARRLRRDAAEHRPDFATLGALGVLEAEHGKVTEAERLFTDARRRYRGVSPFPVAELDFRRGLMWLGEHALPTACAWFGAAVGRVPAYGPALGHLAEVDAALGARDTAIDRLRPLAVSKDDPEYAASLAGVLSDAGHPQEAEHWRISAAARYDELVLRHPQAFVDHAADFWLTVGGDRPKGRQLALGNHIGRATRAPAILHRVISSG